MNRGTWDIMTYHKIELLEEELRDLEEERIRLETWLEENTTSIDAAKKKLSRLNESTYEDDLRDNEADNWRGET